MVHNSSMAHSRSAPSSLPFRRNSLSYPQESFTNFSLSPGSLLWRRREATYANTLLYQLDVLRRTGRYDAFRLKWHQSYDDKPDVWPVPNHLFWDSDIAKWIEGACYFLQGGPNPEIESAVHELVEMIRSAQQPDGYINIHYTVVEPGKRFTNLRDMHELFNAGHLIEAALAHHHYFQTDRLLEPILRYVKLLCETFGPSTNQTHGYPGHPEIELALLRLWSRVGDEQIWKLAEYFIRERGNPQGVEGMHYYVKEAELRQDDPDKRPVYWADSSSLWYYQAHKPIVQQDSIEGHSVRAMYLLTAAADLVHVDAQGVDATLLAAIKQLWRNMVDKKMYITGGIGAIKQWEGFGLDYFLPQGTDENGCYSETCAAIGVMMLAQRLLQVDLRGEYGDIMELCLYNTVLGSMSHDGKKFTYVNQLASSDHDPCKREEWFTCACCPPNILRLLGQIGGYVASFDVDSDQNAASIYINLFLSSSLQFEVDGSGVTFTQRCDWPWSGDIECELQTSLQTVDICFRVPGWTDTVSLEPECPERKESDGYIRLPASWVFSNPSFKISIPMKPRMISPHPFTTQNTISLARGPIVYCVEDVDNPWVEDHFKSLQLDPSCDVDEIEVNDDKTGDKYIALTVKKGASRLRAGQIQAKPTICSKLLNQLESDGEMLEELRFIPYYFRANRCGRGQMRVGLRRQSK